MNPKRRYAQMKNKLPKATAFRKQLAMPKTTEY